MHCRMRMMSMQTYPFMCMSIMLLGFGKLPQPLAEWIECSITRNEDLNFAFFEINHDRWVMGQHYIAWHSLLYGCWITVITFAIHNSLFHFLYHLLRPRNGTMPQHVRTVFRLLMPSQSFRVPHTLKLWRLFE